MRFLLFLGVLFLGLSCRKQSSAEFYRLEADYSILVAREGDDAYGTGQMERILNGLENVPAEALEGPRAVALVATIKAEQERVRAERLPAPPVQQPASPFLGVESSAAPATKEPVDSGTVDAGPPEPFAGMAEKDFLAFYGSCFEAGPATNIDGGRGTSHVLVARPECQKRFGTVGSTTSYLFVGSGLWGKRTETTTWVEVDAGTRIQAVPRPSEDETPQPLLVIPGAPMPQPTEVPPGG